MPSHRIDSHCLQLTSPDKTQTLARQLGSSAPAGSVLLLVGDLGSGKTTFVQGLGQGLGIEDGIVSPTFTLVREYWEGRQPLFHCDLYRLDPLAVTELSLDELWDGAGIVAIEWPERLPELPPEWLRLTLTAMGETSRQVHAAAMGDRHWQWWETAVRQLSSSPLQSE